MIASTKGQFEIVKLLLQDGRADPASRNNRSIENASYNGHIKVVEFLLQDRRVDPTADDSKALKWACYHGNVKLLLQDGRVEPSDWAINNTKTEEIREMLVSYKYRVDGKEYCRLKI
jgi:ankyrin repeat protein